MHEKPKFKRLVSRHLLYYHPYTISGPKSFHIAAPKQPGRDTPKKVITSKIPHEAKNEYGDQKNSIVNIKTGANNPSLSCSELLRQRTAC